MTFPTRATTTVSGSGKGGFDKDPIGEAEQIRDWNLRAVYGAFNAMKNRDGADKHQNAFLTWVAFIGGPRESRRLLGDVVLTQEDIVTKRDFSDGCVPSTWSIDLALPQGSSTPRSFPTIRSSPSPYTTDVSIAAMAIRFPTAASTPATSTTCSWRVAASASRTRRWGPFGS